MGLPSENLTPTQTDGVAAFAAQLGTWAIRIQHSASFHKARTHDTYLLPVSLLKVQVGTLLTYQNDPHLRHRAVAEMGTLIPDSSHTCLSTVVTQSRSSQWEGTIRAICCAQ